MHGYKIFMPMQVVEVPGDHFSLLRQDEADMTVLVSALKTALAPYGWTEQKQSSKRPYIMTKVQRLPSPAVCLQIKS